MNFLMLRSNQNAAQEQQTVKENQSDSQSLPTLQGLIAEDPFTDRKSSENREEGNTESGVTSGSNTENKPQIMDNHVDVSEDEGWITIPYKELPDDWRESPDIDSFRSLDRFFVFPGEQVHILACLSACNQDTEIITPFKVAAVMNKNGIGYTNKKQNGNIANEVLSEAEKVENDPETLDTLSDVSSGESLLRLEVQKTQTQRLLQRFSNSHFFVRVAESNEPLWSSKVVQDSSEITEQSKKNTNKKTSFNAFVDRGKFDSTTSGGVARDAVKCHALPNGDIVVLLQINIGVDVLKEPVLEILQFEKYEEINFTSKNDENLVLPDQDPCGELLKWLLPLDNSITPPTPSLSSNPPNINPNIRSTSIKPTLSSSSSSQLFSFGHFRSYSMSSLPPNAVAPPSTTTAPPPTTTAPPLATPVVPTLTSKTSFDHEDWDRFSFNKTLRNEKSGNEGLLSFRGVPLEPERFSVRCGLEGIYVPGKRWRRKIEIIQPVEINSFAAECNTDDLLYVQIKNISPTHIPDVVVYIDAITIVFDDASKGGLPLSFPIACIEAGNEFTLPNLPLRRGEEHSFILKPAISMWKNRNTQISQSKNNVLSADQYAVLVSCRCNYTESRLFFKQPTSWRPRISRDLMISVASEMSRQTCGSNGRVAQLPVQVLTLQATNLTSEDLILTVLAPASFTCPPSVVSLSSSPTSPISPFVGVTEFNDRRSMNVGPTNHEGENFNEQHTVSDVLIPNVDLGCTHLWLQSKVPLGCVPARSTATIKLEVLPLTDGIITLDSLQIDVKEKGVTYIPEHSLKINATSSISTGII